MEIVVVDAGCKDDTMAVVASLKTNIPIRCLLGVRTVLVPPSLNKRIARLSTVLRYGRIRQGDTDQRTDPFFTFYEISPMERT